MKNFIVALDGLKFSQSAVEYAIHLSKKANAHLTGVFLDDLTYHSYKIYELITEDEAMEDKKIRLEAVDDAKRDDAVKSFEAMCRKETVNFSVHHDRNIAIRELLEESIYADLIIIDSRETLTHYEETLPTRFLRNLLENAHCPVLAVPDSFVPIEKIIMLYDGHPSSVLAIKSFSQLFSSVSEIKIEVFTVDDEKQHQLRNFRLLKEFLKQHFTEVIYKSWKGDPEELIVAHIRNLKFNSLIVLGAYQRGMVSRWFRASMADRLIKQLETPLFITHS